MCIFPMLVNVHQLHNIPYELFDSSLFSHFVFSFVGYQCTVYHNDETVSATLTGSVLVRLLTLYQCAFQTMRYDQNSLEDSDCHQKSLTQNNMIQSGEKKFFKSKIYCCSILGKKCKNNKCFASQNQLYSVTYII